MLEDDFNTARELTKNNEDHAAITLYEKILQHHPSHIASHYNLAQLYAQHGELEKAHLHFAQVISLAPDFPQGHFQLAQIFLIKETPLAALAQLKLAIRLAPDYIDAQHLLACTALQQQQFELARVHFEQLLSLAPHHADGQLNFALLKFQQRDIAGAKQLLDTVLALDPTLVEAHYHRGVIAMQQGDIERAILEMQETLDRQASHFAANYNLAILYKMQHHNQLATHFLKQAQALKPEDEHIVFLLHALEQDQTPQQAPLSLVRELFNHYAEHYDTHMQKSLHYQVPQLLRELLNCAAVPLPADPVILDLGCGTGLVGEAFKDLGTQHIGVDIAKEMLAQAKVRGIYAQLYEQDLLDYLQHAPEQSVDLIIAADVFGYWGALDKIFLACTQLLRPHGLLLFSIEINKTTDYCLQPCARFAHHENYIADLSIDFQLHLLAKKPVILRHQENTGVNGAIFLYQKLPV